MATALTDKAVQAAKAKPGQRLELRDSKSPGLCLRVTDKGVKTWVVRYRTLDGRQPRYTLGLAQDISLREAREQAADVRRAARAGNDPAEGKRQAVREARAQKLRTVGDLAEAYFTAVSSGAYKATKAGKKAATIAAERRLWAFRLRTSLAGERLDDVRRTDVRRLLGVIAAEAPIQANRARALLRTMFGFAISEERLTTNPVAGVDPPSSEKPRSRVLTDVELRTLWRGLEDTDALRIKRDDEDEAVHVSPAVSIALRLAALTLQRRSEVSGMRLDELRLDEATWTIAPERMKNGQAHLVPLSPAAVALVREALALHDPDRPSTVVFPTRWKKLSGKPIDGGALSHALSDVYEALGIEDANLHDLRRTGASNMASERLMIPPVVISRVLAHTVDGAGGAAVTSRHYAIHDYAPEKRRALTAWADLLAAIIEGREMASNVTPLRA